MNQMRLDDMPGAAPDGGHEPQQPALAGDAATIADARRRLFELRLKTRAGGLAGAPAAPDSAWPAGPVASHAQEALWFIERLLGSSDLYHVTQAVRLKGPLDVDALERSLSALIERHSCLRTGFEERDGKPVPVVHPAEPARLELFAAEGRTANERERSTQQLLEAGAVQPFDLTRPPLIRARLVRLAVDEHVLLLVAHHIVTDGWSAGVIASDISALYAAFCGGRPPSLPALRASYVDFALSQRRRVASEAGAEDLRYWRSQLEGLEPLELPGDPGAPKRAQREGRIELAIVPANLACELKTLARREGATLFMVLLAAYQTLLMRLSGRDDFSVGVPVAGRNRTDLEGVVGYFVNSLVIRTGLSGSPSFRELLARTQQTALDALAHQETPFEQLVMDLAPERDLDRNPLFDLMFNYTEGLRGSFSLPGLDCKSEVLQRIPAKFAMTIYAEAEGDTVQLRLAYRGDRFSPARAASMLQQYMGLLEQIVGKPDASIQSYSLVTPSARKLLPDPVAEIAAPPQPCVPNQFLEWVRRSPERVALRQGERRTSYRELASNALGLASKLRERGIGRGDIVAIQMPRGTALVEAMLATLVSGAAFMVIDSALPRERRIVMLRESRARLLCVPETSDAAFDAQYPNLDTIRIAAGAKSDHADTPATWPMVNIGGDDPAYIFFTSGSTGEPKAILGRHKSLGHFLNWQRTRYGITPEDRVSQLIGLSFDPMLRDVFLPLTSGATLCIPEAADVPDPIGWLQRERVTVVHSTPAVLQSWLAERSGSAELTNLRWLFISGEPLLDSLVWKWRRGPGRLSRIVNFYGPTETTMIRCAYEVPQAVEPGVQPIGQPLPESQALIINAAGDLCGIGEPGEIALRTPFSTLGYLNLPEENRRRFRKNSFRDDKSDLVYYTGDRGRYRPDGLLEICGRLDDQVKIRGVRIEPGEVVAALSHHEGVRECAVVARPNAYGEPALVAYFVADGEAAPDASGLRAFLKQRLAGPLVPSAYVRLDALPMLPNGKIDRKALPPPDWGAPSTEYVAPCSEIEKTLAKIFEEVLGLERVGLRDDFFELGGHSLNATRVMARACEALGVEVPLRAVFETPNIEELAQAFAAVGKTDAASKRPLLLDLRQGGTRQPTDSVAVDIGSGAGMPDVASLAEAAAAPLSFAQEALWFLDRLTGPSSVYNIAMRARLVGPLRIDALERGLHALAERHEVLQSSIGEQDGQPMQHVIREAIPGLHVEDLEQLPIGIREETLQQKLLLQASVPFDLRQAPLMRGCLYRLAPDEHVLLLVVHHIVADGWSRSIIARDLGELYSAFVNGAEPKLPRLPFQFGGFARLQRQQAIGGALRESLEYWTSQLSGLEAIELPLDRPRPVRPSQRGGVVRFEVPTQRLERLKSLAQGAHATLYMVLLAALKVLLMRYGARPDIAVGTPIAGRALPGLEVLVGYFVNTLVMRTDLSGDPSFEGVLKLVRKTSLDAYAHQDVPFDMLVQQLNPEREFGRNPLYQVAFALQNVPSAELPIGTSPARLESIHTDTAKFDLSLVMTERGGMLDARFEYSADLFDRATIERMTGHFGNLIDGILANPQARISTLPMMSPEELRQALVNWNDTARDYPHQKTLNKLFEEQAARTPDACAVVFEHRTALDYDALNRRANRLAHRLRGLGVGPDVLVGLCMNRQPEMVVAMLGVLKAGGAYLPIDVDYPAERIAFMLEDGAVPVVLTEQAMLGRLLDTGTRAKVIALDSPAWRERSASLPTDAPQPLAGPENLAYVIYTSGSTGRPKGVMVPHRAVARLVCNTDYVRINPSDCIAQASSSSFDAATFEIWGSLLNGARLAIVPTDTLLSAPALKRQIAEDGIDTMFVTTALFNEHAANAPDAFGGLRSLLFGGEAVNAAAVTRVLRSGRPERLVHVYGPTETTTFASWHEATPLQPGEEGPETIPIGRPIANTTCHVLDASMQPVPTGATGDLWIGGPGLARGYLNRPELDTERFVADPFSPGSRLYRSGDRARRLADGAIVFAGRSDDQVKLRGFRIELGEVGAAISALPGIAQQTVIVREDMPGDRRLAAYIVWQAGAEHMDAAGLRAALAARLPSFMIPTAFIALGALPLTPNGKLDRAALPAPSAEARGKALDTSDDGDDLERELRAIWESVLGQSGISLDADFFDLGGHSILAVRVLAEIDRRMGRQLRTAAFFEAPTIRSFARLLRDEGALVARGCVVTVQQGDGMRPLFFVSGFGGEVIVFTELIKALDPAQSLHVLDTGAFAADAPGLTIEGIAAAMIDDMRRIQPRGPYRLAGYSMGGKIVHEIAQQLHRAGEQVALLALLDCSGPGYPKRSSAPIRVLLHLRKVLSMKPSEWLSYLSGRAYWMVRNLRPIEKKIFEGGLIEETALTREIERNAQAVLAAWRAYRPSHYPGSVMLIRAEKVQPPHVGETRDDPTYGWGAISGGGVGLRSMQCTHGEMLRQPHTAALASILAGAIARDDGQADAPERQQSERAHAVVEAFARDGDA